MVKMHSISTIEFILRKSWPVFQRNQNYQLRCLRNLGKRLAATQFGLADSLLPFWVILNPVLHPINTNSAPNCNTCNDCLSSVSSNRRLASDLTSVSRSKFASHLFHQMKQFHPMCVPRYVLEQFRKFNRVSIPAVTQDIVGTEEKSYSKLQRFY